MDNAGVTKNMAKMWEDYAKARGVATTSLTQAQKVEAEYLGIMEETKAQMGDMGKLSQGLAGSQAEAANQSQLLAQSFGEAMTPMVQAGTEMFSGLLSGLTGVTEAFPGVTAGATGAAAAFTALVTAASGLATIKKLLEVLSITKNLTTPLGWAAAALGVLVGAYTAIKKHQEEIAKRGRARCQDQRGGRRAEGARENA